MNKAKLIFLAAVLLAVSAAGVVGFVATRPPNKPVAEQSWLGETLKLSPQQRDQMKSIWTRTMDDVMRKIGERRKTLRDERDAAFHELLTPDQLLEWEQIQQSYNNGLRELDRQKETAFKKAAEETKGILSADQAKQYEQMLNDRRSHGDREGRRSPGAAMHGSEGVPDFRAPVRRGGPTSRPDGAF